MGNAPKRKTTTRPQITPEAAKIAHELDLVQNGVFTGTPHDVFVLQRMAELDQRRQTQIENQKAVIGRLVSLLEGELPQAPETIVYMLNGIGLRVDSVEMSETTVVIEFEEA